MQKDSCLVCMITANKIPSKKIYEDDFVMAVLDVNGSNPGHCFIFPKSHYPIFEQVPDEELGRAFQLSNKISTAIFDALKCQGTNIFVANGIPAGQTVAHFTINVIPRFQNDGINLQWQPRQLDEEEMSTIELKMKEQLGKSAPAKADVANPKPKKENAEIGSSSYEKELIKRQLTRIP